MCGIMGYTGHRQAMPIVLDGLSRIEYRGYDSAGIAILGPSGVFGTNKAVGKLDALRADLEGSFVSGSLGLGHTRWATHGAPSLANAHPHMDCTGRVAVVQNGIVENYSTLAAQLVSRGHRFMSQTDTEVLPHLIEEALDRGLDPVEAVQSILPDMHGALVFLVACAQEPDTLIAVRAGNAGGLVVGVGDGEMYAASDLPALVPLTRQAMPLNNGEIAVLRPDGVEVSTLDGEPVSREFTEVTRDPLRAAKGMYKHFMLKEIMEQPQALTDALRGRVDLESGRLEPDYGAGLSERLAAAKRIILTGCGSSYHAALVGRHYFETLADVPVEAELASELRHRNARMGKGDLFIAITQSGETLDTLAALEHASSLGADCVAVTNALDSEAARIACETMDMRSGLEVGVASTKSFTSAIICLYLLAIDAAAGRGVMDEDEVSRHLLDLERLPGIVSEMLERGDVIRAAAERLTANENCLLLGRGPLYAIALEGALKLKEVTYIHAEGSAGGEMKHGPIALIDQSMPTIALAPEGGLRDRMAINISEIRARAGHVVGVLTDGDDELGGQADEAIFMPETPAHLVPIAATVPLQMLAYEIGLLRGADIDQPRNLAKSVTVE